MKLRECGHRRQIRSPHSRGSKSEDCAFLATVLVQPETRCRATTNQCAPGSSLLAFDDSARARACARSDADHRSSAAGSWHPVVLVFIVQDAGTVEYGDPTIPNPDAVFVAPDEAAVLVSALSRRSCRQRQRKEAESEQDARKLLYHTLPPEWFS